MSEKRFKGYAEKTGQHFELIINDLLGEEYSLTDDFFKSKDVIFEIVDLLNVMNNTLLKQADENHKLSNKNIEQQATINKLNDELELTSNIKLYSRRELERKVDEQQATINELKERNAHNFAKNIQLKKEIKELKEEEKLYAKEIVRLNKNIEELNKTIEEALKFKSLGGDY